MSRYEVLRSGVFGEPIALEARRGLTLLLRRGMWAWARAVRDDPQRAQVVRPPVAALLVQPDALTQLLAEMVLPLARRAQ